MKIKIINCSDSMFWYRGDIGKIYTVERVEGSIFWCREDNEYRALNVVLSKDCEVLNEKEKD